MEQLELRLTPAEAVQLAQYEAIIAAGLQTFVEVGTALLAIRDAKLYREQFPTFETYCRERWAIARRTAYQLMEAAAVVENVRNCAQILPANESQTRPLVGLEPAVQQAVWQQAVDTAPAGKVTAKHVAAVVQQHQALDTTGPKTFKEALASYPTPDEAREMARQNGKIYLDKTGHWQSGVTDQEVQIGMAYHALLKALETLAAPPGPPAMLLHYTPFYWIENMTEWLPQILAYLHDYALAIDDHQKGETHGEHSCT